jgi:hypothetical protein
MKLTAIRSIVLTLLITLATAIGISAPASAQTTYPPQYVEVNCGSAVSGASVTFTNATPAVGTWTSPPWTITGSVTAVACPIYITANAPTGLSNTTNYWAVPIPGAPSTFWVASSAANALAGTYIATSATSSTANITSDNVLTTTSVGITAAVALPIGDWDCGSSTYYVPTASTSVTNLQQGLSLSATTIGALGTYSDLETAANVMTVTNNPVMVSPLVRQSIGATTNVYSLTFATFTASTLYASADLRCRKWWN